MAKKVKFDTSTSFDFGANRKPKSSGGKAKAGGAKRKPSGVRVWKGQTYGS